MAAIQINWSDLATVAEVSLAFAVGIAVVFTLGALGVARAAGKDDGTPLPGGRAGSLAIAGVAFAACAAAVLYGLWLIIPQFHS